MASYHRLLKAFGRATSDNDIQCDCDIHPWDISINAQQWSGKIRFVAFIDVFFLLCYTNNSRLERGIVVYKYQDNITDLCTRSNIAPPPFSDDARPALARTQSAPPPPYSPVDSTAYQTPPQSPGETEKLAAAAAGALPADAVPPKKTGDVDFSSDSTFYTVRGRGHAVGLKLRYPAREWTSYKIEIRKQGDPLKNRRIKRGLKKHDTLDLLEDSAKIGIIAGGEVVGHATGHMVMGGFLEDAGRKYVDGVTSAQRSSQVTLSGDM
ncbi:hypothetical protein EDC01DRAFT_121019 [Geopyxis carbonaria]|nr:hypothetical protein EDC01DRAFT_121019 [Geopyxis carbonaria]